MKTSTFRALVVGSVLGLTASFVSCSGTPACSTTSCIGCCSTNGTCQNGNEGQACGAAGNQCLVCVTGQVCLAGACVASNNGGGSGGGTAGGTGGGTAGGSAGGSAGGTAGGTAGGSGGGTAGGSAGTPPTVNITYMATCPAFTPCGGAVDGTWFYTQACVDDAAFEVVTNALSTYCSNIVVSNKTGTVSGSVVFSGTNVTRSVTGSINFRVEGDGTTCLSACSLIGSGLASYGASGSCATVSPDGGTPDKCRCDISAPINNGGSDTYTSANNTISLTPSGRTYTYCVNGAGTSLNYLDTTQASGSVRPDPGTYVLTKQ